MKTRRIIALLALAVAATVVASATPTQCANISSGAFTNGSLLNDTTDTCTLLDGQVFSLFSVYAQSGFGGAGSAFSLTVSVNGNQLIFGTTTLVGEDVTIYFKTSPGITFVTLGTGPADNVVEGICAGLPNESVGSEVCPGGATFLNTSVLSASNGSTSSSNVNASSTDWFIKDDSGGSQLTQSFNSTVPEPMTLSMMGVGLLGLGLIGRKLRK
jgi:hypothetical protein